MAISRYVTGATMDQNPEKKLALRDFILSITWVVALYWKISPLFTVGYFSAQIIQAFNPIIYSYLIASVLDSAVDADPETSIRSLVPLGVVFVAFYVFFSLVGYVGSYTNSQLSMITMPRVRLMMYQKLKSLGIESLEKPEINNLMERAQREIYNLFRQLQRVVALASALATAIGAGLILFNFSPFLTVVIFLVAIPTIIIDQKYLSRQWKYERSITEEFRKANDSIYTLMDSQKLHELIITKGYIYLEKIYKKLIGKYIAAFTQIRKKWYSLGFSIQIISAGVYSGGFIYIFYSLIRGIITVGRTTFLLQNVRSFVQSIERVNLQYTQIYEAALRISEIQEVFDLKPSFKDGTINQPLLIKGPEITLENVNFSYPGSNTNVIRNMNLAIKSGEKIAIVGANGAGKTTLVKLISRFYQVNSGQIMINGVNVNDIAIDSLYKNLSVLFQEYNTYRFLTATENIQIGNADKKNDMSTVKKAAIKADADDFIKEYDNGYDQILSEKYKGGVRPSTGQWQKIAIARFFYRNSPLVIFDEPTAAIDAVAEKKIFNKIYKFFKGKTVIIISHRFSTVRNADRIIVVDKGEIIEEGSHSELIKMGGVYEKAFKLQAEGYN